MKAIAVPALTSIMFAVFSFTTPHTEAVRTSAGGPDWMPIECPADIPARYNVECGMVDVPEDHANPGGPQIRIAVAVVRSTGDDPAPDPLLFINGGPGARTLDGIRLWLETFSPGPLLSGRDIVFFDQRGTGYSRPALVCSSFPPADPLAGFRDAAAVAACRDELEHAGIDPGLYTSAQNAGDIAALRQALGYGQWNLYGVSYGARIALTVLRDHPEGVRSAVLDAVTPVEADLLTEDPAYAQMALDRLFAACRADLLCSIAYPGIESVYEELAGELAANPVSLEIADPDTGRIRIETVNGAVLNGTVLGMLGSAEAAGIPGLIHELRAGNFAPLVSDFQAAWEAEQAFPPKPAPLGAQLAMICGEEAPFVTGGEMEQASSAYPPETNFLTVIDSSFYAACRVWGIGPADPLEDAPVESGIPVLILAGEYDTARPPDEARRAAQRLANGTLVEFPGAGHAVALAGTCPLSVMAQFLDDPSAAPDAGCTARMGGPRFFLTIGLTRPFARIAAAAAGIAGLAVLAYGVIGVVRSAVSRRIPWRVTLRRTGWLPLAIPALLAPVMYGIWPAAGLDHFYEHSLAQIAVMTGPLVIAIQTAFFFAPEDEPSLEVTLACPRPFHWIAVERTALALAGQAAIVAVTLAVGAWGLGERLPVAGPAVFLWWLSSALALSGLAAFAAARSRRAMVGILLALLTWLVLGATSSFRFDEVLLPPVPLGFHFGWPRLVDAIQPFFWPFYPFLRPGSVSAGDFMLNRIVAGGLGLALLALAAGKLADPEHMLLGAAARPPRAGRGIRLSRSLGQAAETAIARIKDIRLIKLLTIVRYEMLMSWRRGSLRSILISILLLPQLFHIITWLFGSMLDETAKAALAGRPEVLILAGTNAALVSNATTVVMAVVLLPLMVAEVIPLDRQHRIHEVVDALPVSKGLYTAGKLLSVWPAILIGLCFSAVLNGLVSRALNGPFRMDTLALFWLGGLIPLALFGTEMGVLFAAGQPNRRRAALTGLAAVAATLAAAFALPVNQMIAAGTFQLALNMAAIDDPRVRAALPDFPDVHSLNVWLRIGGVVLAMAAVWLFAVGRPRRGNAERSREALQ